ELRGKYPMSVAEGADLKKRVAGGGLGPLMNGGQACLSIERIYGVEPIYDKFVNKVVEEVRALKVGGDDAHLGAMTSSAQIGIVRDHLQDAIAKGARALTGGPDAISGQYIQPALLVHVTPDKKIMKEEAVAPVVP